ncbi:ferrochelatase [Ereboglobus sp. PH5-5]|uniref:ferrochelatase n=1 Tax=Ereboglobus sp. PH5-5 TaxID=2940529 RepID=UPI0024067248|nr:ferrochelatase [Ereboglobus sp. PH5-5]MDF9833460.1 ferrochelatase [Ereboglobus sp. PH5-5]
MSSKRAVLLVNLGSPDSPAVADVRRYLSEFLGDSRVIDRPRFAWMRSLLVNRIIIPRRVENSAHAYASIWTEKGSPLVVTSMSVREKLAAVLGGDGRAKPQAEPESAAPANDPTETPNNGSPGGFALPSPPTVYLAMRYGKPSIASVVAQMAADGVGHVLLFPQYPHYAMSSWETLVVEVYAQAARLAPQMRIDCVQPFYKDDDYLAALVESAKPYLAQPHDHLLISLHGIPERHLREADKSRAHCLCAKDCCEVDSPAHATCYRAQVLGTARGFAARAGIAPERYSITFQSRLVGEPWLSPYTDETLAQLPARGIKRLLVLSPAFVTDCLETLEELMVAGQKTFLDAGGESFQQIPCLNDQPAYVDFLANRARQWMRSGTA